MYSMVVMMAMSTSPEAVACGKLFNKGCTGCYGSSCTGYVVTSTSCTGCYGGTSCHGTKLKLFGGGCTGGGLFSGFKAKGCHGCTGCTGYVPYTGCTGGMGCTGGVIVSPPPVVVPAPKKEMPKAEPKATSAPATITLMVPADAKVTIDGTATTSTSSVRLFTTPELPYGNVYSYTFTAEVVRDGKVFTTSKQVAVTPGETAKVELNPGTVTTVAAR